MTLIQSLLLGFIQGLTEFLPVSSSAHLVIIPYLLKWNILPTEAFIFDVLVQVASLIAVFAYFWRDILAILRAVLNGLLQRRPLADPQSRLGWFIILATIPAGITGLFFKDLIQNTFNSPKMTAIFLLGTAGLLFLAERIGKRIRSLAQITWKDALVIGLFQALAPLPGISRSGATITGGMLRDLERPAAARFSFLLSIPIMLAAGLLAILDLIKIPNLVSLLPIYIPGFLMAAVVGYLAIRWLIGFLGRRPLYIFSVYCLVVGLFVLIIM